MLSGNTEYSPTNKSTHFIKIILSAFYQFKKTIPNRILLPNLKIMSILIKFRIVTHTFNPPTVASYLLNYPHSVKICCNKFNSNDFFHYKHFTSLLASSTKSAATFYFGTKMLNFRSIQ